MAALLDVAQRPAEAADEEIAQPLFGAREVVGRVQRPEDIVVWHLPVEGGDQAGETVLANRGTAQFATRYFVLYLG